jgi:glyoxylase-like metal-dependent hydrolase (beta-lactamase superfamily II)
MKICDGIHLFPWTSFRENNCNTYLIEGSKRILIDPGHAHLLHHVEVGLRSLGLGFEDIHVVLVTHGHPDHQEGAERFAGKALFAMGGTEYGLIKRYAGSYISCPEPDFLLQEGRLEIGDVQFDILETPGHSPASICLYELRQKALFSGDVVFHQGIGRSDLPGGDSALLKQSIIRLSNLDVAYLLPGHGEAVRGRKAVENNFRSIETQWFPYL